MRLIPPRDEADSIYNAERDDIRAADTIDNTDAIGNVDSVYHVAMGSVETTSSKEGDIRARDDLG